MFEVENVRVDNVEDGILSAVRILEERRETSTPRQEDASNDTLTPIIKRRLQYYRSEDTTPRLADTVGEESVARRTSSASSSTCGRRSLRLIGRGISTKSSKEKLQDDIAHRLKTVGARKRRRSFGVSWVSARDLEKAIATPEKITLISEVNPVIVAATSEAEEDIDVERVSLETPAKRSSCSDVEYDRLCESIQPNLSFDNVQFLDDFDIIDDLLSNSAIADLLEEHRNEDKENAQFEEAENSSDRRHSLRSRVVAHPMTERSAETSAVEDKVEHKTEDEEEETEEENEKSDEPLSHDVIQKLRSVQVRLEHEVPPQHQVEARRTCCPLTPNERREFERHAVLRVGRFSAKEDAIIRRNWRRFCEVHDLKITKQRFFKMRYHGRNFINLPHERRKFVQFLANGLPWRTLRAVFARFRVLYGYEILQNSNKKRYTKEEDAKIVKYMESEKYLHRKTEILTNLIGRPYTAIYERYKRICKKKEDAKSTKQKKSNGLVWTLELMESFLKHLMDVTISEEIGELKDATIPKSVWLKLQSVMELQHVDWSVLKEHWRLVLHQQLFCSRPIFYNELQIMLIEYFYAMGITGPGDVSWSDIARNFDGCTPRFLYMTLPQLLRVSLRSETQLGDAVERLYREKIPQLKAQSFDSYLPRMTYSGGKLQVIDDFPPVEV